MLLRSRCWLLFLHWALLCGGLPTAAQQPPEFPLRLRETIPVAGDTGAGFTWPIKCDSKGNLYVRFSDALGRHMSTPVTRILLDGRVEAAFRLDAAPGFHADDTFDDFAVDSRGRVYLLTERLTEGKDFESLILAYDSDGKFSSVIKLERFFSGDKLAVFTTGEFLATGEKLDCKDGECQSTGHTFTGIFDRQGRLVQEMELPDDIEARPNEPKAPPLDAAADRPAALPAAQSEPPAGTAKLSSEGFSRALSMGSAVAADDGNVYVMRATPDPIVYALGRDGSVVRRLVVVAPSEHASAAAFQVAGGRLVVIFTERNAAGKFRRIVFVVADAETGEPIAHYVTAPGTSATGCYSPDGFCLLGSDKGRLVIQKTYPY